MAWLSLAYKYRRPITLSNSGSGLTDYQTLITLDTASLISAGKMKSDGSDIRFTDDDGTTLLGYWIESGINTSSTKIWVKVPSIPNGSKTIYLYYGNPSATAVSSIANTFIREIDSGQPLKGCWHFDEGSGTTAYDSSGNNRNGTLLNGASWTTSGKYGKAINLDGTDDYIDVGDFAIGGEISVEGWVYPTAHQSYQKLMEFANGTPSDNILMTASQGTGGNPYFQVFVGTTGYMATSPDAISLNAWHHLVGVLGGNRLKLYVDNTLKADVSGPSGVNNVTRTNQYIGRSNWPGDAYFRGYIDEVRIYNKALSSSEISDLYNYYGYTTTNYPGRVLVKKYASTEPTVSIGTETPLPNFFPFL